MALLGGRRGGFVLTYDGLPIGCITNIKPPGYTREKVSCACLTDELEETGCAYKTYEPSNTVEITDLEGTMKYDPCEEPACDVTCKEVILIHPDDDTCIWTFEGFFNSFEPDNIDVEASDEAATATFSIAVCSVIVKT